MRASLSTLAARGVQRGLSMVELLVGMAIALFITATGATLLAGNLRESRSLLLEARLMQDLRTAADVVSRDLRRAGYWGSASNGVWDAGASRVDSNPYHGVSPTNVTAAEVAFRYSRDAIENDLVDSNEQFGFRLRGGAIELQLGAGNWQALTDVGTMIVTGFDVTPSAQDIDLQGFCPTECPVGSTTCPPRQQVRSLAVTISGRLANDARVTRSVRSHVRLRNDPITGACAS